MVNITPFFHIYRMGAGFIMEIEQSRTFEDECISVEIELEKVYSLPDEIKIIKHDGVYLAIYTEGVLWIVLQDDEELNVFNAIRKGEKIESLFEKYSDEAVTNVIMQIEAKKFEHPKRMEQDEKEVCIYLTNNCNQRCRHCYMYAGEIVIEESSVEKWIVVLDKLKNVGFEGVIFTGGEITIYKGFDILIKHAHDIGLRVTVLSNGVLWDKKLIEELHFYIDEIQVSVDGYDAESYYSVRRYDGFEKAINCIKEFSDRGTRVSMAVTPLYEKLDDFIEKFKLFAKNFLKENPEVFIKLNHELIPGREIRTSEEKNAEYKKKLKALMEWLYPEYYTETFVLNYENRTIRRNCGFGELTIGANGDVFWCNRIHELSSKLNVFKSDIRAILEMRDYIRNSTSVDNTAGCKDCEVRYICGGGCRMKYEGIKEAETHEGMWKHECEGKDYLYEKMILSNEYFFEQ